MSDKTIELNRRRVLGGMITLGGAAAAAGAGTFAYFSDSENSTGNTVSAGTLSLDFDTSTTESFAFDEMTPGTEQDHTWTLKNTGELSGSLDVNVTINEDSSSNDDSSSDVTETELAKAIEVTTLQYDGDIADRIEGTTTGPSGYFTTSSYSSLDNLANNKHNSGTETADNDLIDLADPTDGGTDFTIGLTLRKEAENPFQAEGLDVAFEFILNQKDSQ